MNQPKSRPECQASPQKRSLAGTGMAPYCALICAHLSTVVPTATVVGPPAASAAAAAASRWRASEEIGGGATNEPRLDIAAEISSARARGQITRSSIAVRVRPGPTPNVFGKGIARREVAREREIGNNSALKTRGRGGRAPPNYRIDTTRLLA